MNVQEFQNKLKEIQEIAKQNENTLKATDIRGVLDGCDLDKSQLTGVLKYLTSQGIMIEGMEKAKETAKEPEYKKVPLTPEEEAYLNEYLENLPVIADIDLDVLFEQLSKGEQSAVQTLASYYMKATAELAADMNAKEILLADLIQEANLSLIQALDNAGEELRDEEWLLAEVRKGILQVIEEQT